MLKFKKGINLIIAFIMLFSAIHVFANESTEEIEEIENVFKHKIIYNDDNTVNIINKSVVNPKIFPDGVEIPIENDGTVLIPMDTKIVSRHQDVHSTHFSKMDTLNNPLLITAFNMKDNPEIVFSDDAVNVLKTMQEKADEYNKNVELFNRVETKPYGSKYYEGDDVHCNRFNGPQSDSVHYNWRDIFQLDKALKNFRGSDCQVALSAGSNCPSMGEEPFCNSQYKAAWCSRYTLYRTSSGTLKFCPKTFHKHPNGPAIGEWA